MVNNTLFALISRSLGVDGPLSDDNGTRAGKPAAYWHGFAPGHKTLAIGALYWLGWPRGRRGPALVLTVDLGAAQRLVNELSSLLPERDVLLFPAREVWPHEELQVPEDVVSARMAALERLALGEPVLVVAPAQAVAEKLPPREVLTERLLTVSVGDVLDRDALAERLVREGYERVPMVERRGQFSVRGGLLDVFPTAAPAPYRIDFFDDEVDSIRCFDPETQRSTEEVNAVRIGPAREYPIVNDEAVLRRIEEAAQRQAEALRRAGAAAGADNLLQRVRTHLDHLAGGRWVPGLDQYKPFFFARLETIVDYLGDEGLVIVDEPARTREQLQLTTREFAETQPDLLERGRALPEQAAIFADWEELAAAFRRRPAAFLAVLPQKVAGLEGVPEIAVKSRPAEMFHGKLDAFISYVRRRRREGWRIVVVTSTDLRAERVQEVLADEDVPAVRQDPGAAALEPGTVVVTSAELHVGCELPGEKLAVLTELEVFGQHKRRQRPSRRAANAARLDDLRPGDLVVHVNHGIGRYRGVETLVIDGAHRDYLLIEYAGDDKLYVPTDQVHLLQKYIGVEGQTPKLNRLGGNEWARAKQRVQQSVKELAQKLLKLYAEREALPGYAFSPDTVWQQEFEEAFPYEETPDQKRAIEEIKADMERPRPMDRLLCGDVGFGKTEVAMRAAFKAVMDARQVAVLVPTTILAQQHLRTFRERFARYPVRIEALSRFQSPAEQARVLKGLADGTVDIVIGTHRLLSKDVVFKDLGCVVIDEEQRFGVAQKERLKELKRNVDVLTLTATPIPRTLHMALVGIRDMSLIETPPEDRFPVRTYVCEYDEDLVREAILRELGREGQVYFVHNRVQDIDRVADRLRQLVPEARIAVAHGQMPEDLLEQVMLDFLNREIDVLVCSTIIETGMDIPNVNTLIVDEADRFGLAQLYQLRGRVGRSNRVAYAYFTYRKDKILTEDAEKRLQAIREFTELGSGFKIALRDLEIRGAGNLLGPEQHGFIASVGFELYCKLLEEAVREVKGEVKREAPDPVIDLNVDAYVSDDYVADPQQKVEIYKRVAGLRTAEEIQDFQEELEDRFGPVPPPVRNLLAVARIKVLARELGVEAVNGTKEEVVIRMLPGLVLPRETVLHLTRQFRGRIVLSAARSAPIRIRRRGLGERDLLALLEQVLREMRAAWPSAKDGGQPEPVGARVAHGGK
ncbi:MAG: transcription-repair coupling factor [Bacillota bacterium]|nr:transcription-repair coupling factor [Bacillota bacterium]